MLILGGGLVASETASLLTDSGHDVALITRALLPGARALGEETARRLLDLHLPQHAAYLGRTLTAIRSHADRITVVLNDGPRVDGRPGDRRPRHHAGGPCALDGTGRHPRR